MVLCAMYSSLNHVPSRTREAETIGKIPSESFPKCFLLFLWNYTQFIVIVLEFLIVPLNISPRTPLAAAAAAATSSGLQA